MIKTLSLTVCLATSGLWAADWADYYDVEKIPLPDNVDHQLGGILNLKDNRVAACFYSGEVMFYDPLTNEWSLFAQGLQCPLGILENEDGSFFVMQWSELTRLTDTDGDGQADHYQTIWDDFGTTGNYHEFAYGPARDSKGNLYVALNVASNNAGIFRNVRGPFSPIGLERDVYANWKTEAEVWKERRAEGGRMYSRVPYRGCIIKITPDGKGSPFAYGFRSPDGINIDDQDRLWVTDNQGDWRGTSPLYHVTEGNFYGHPASLIWKPGWEGHPLEVPTEELNSMRTPAAGLFPHGELANSPTQPIPTIDPSLFGLPKGELLIGDMNQPTLIRFLDDEVDGVVQGTMIPFLFSMELGIGNHRLDFAEDGALWIGKTHLKWAGDEGMARVTWNKNPIFIVDDVTLLKNGFKLSFNHPLGHETPAVAISRHTYHYHEEYGSPKVDLKDVPISAIQISEDRQSITVTLPQIDKGYLYNIDLGGTVDAHNKPLMGSLLRYNVVRKL